MLKAEIDEVKKDYVEMRRIVFNDHVFLDQLAVSFHQVEIVQEGIGLHTSDVSQTFKDLARCQSIKVHHSQTNTHYFNIPGRRQLKIYQKGIGILRMEATFNSEVRDVLLELREPTDHIVRVVMAELEDLLQDMNLPVHWWKVHTIERDKLVWLFANALRLTDEAQRVDVNLMKSLLTSKDWDSNRFNEALTKRLRRKKLIEPVMRGKYVPTENLLMIQELFNKLDRLQVYENDIRRSSDDHL